MMSPFNEKICISEMQVLEFRLFNIPQGTQVLRGRLPITPGSSLCWFGFSEEGQLCSYDSKVLIVFPLVLIFGIYSILMNAYCYTVIPANFVSIICRVC